MLIHIIGILLIIMAMSGFAWTAKSDGIKSYIILVISLLLLVLALIIRMFV